MKVTWRTKCRWREQLACEPRRISRLVSRRWKIQDGKSVWARRLGNSWWFLHCIYVTNTSKYPHSPRVRNRAPEDSTEFPRRWISFWKYSNARFLSAHRIDKIEHEAHKHDARFYTKNPGGFGAFETWSPGVDNTRLWWAWFWRFLQAHELWTTRPQ